MPFVRNPFRRQDENVRPVINGAHKPEDGATSDPTSMQEKQPVEYKLSEINDSGVFVPPSPPLRPSFWTTTSSSMSTTSSKNRSLFDENEPFNISRESFDSYRRSFDISARSPIIQSETKPRSSLDSRTFLPPPRPSGTFHRPLQVPGTQQEEENEILEDIALDDPRPQAPPRKRGMFSRIMDSDSHAERPPSQDGNTKAWHHFGGRKRGQSGQGAELGSIPKREELSSVAKREETPKPETQVKKEETQPEMQVKKDASKPETQLKKEDRQAKPGAENAQAPEAEVDASQIR